MNQEIVNAIAAYLEENTGATGYYEEVQFVRSGGRADHAKFCQEIAQEIAGKIEPLLPKAVGWEDAPDWAQFRTEDEEFGITFWEFKPRLQGKYWTQPIDGGMFLSINPVVIPIVEERPNDQTPSSVR